MKIRLAEKRIQYHKEGGRDSTFFFDVIDPAVGKIATLKFYEDMTTTDMSNLARYSYSAKDLVSFGEYVQDTIRKHTLTKQI